MAEFILYYIAAGVATAVFLTALQVLASRLNPETKFNMDFLMFFLIVLLWWLELATLLIRIPLIIVSSVRLAWSVRRTKKRMGEET